MPKKNRDMRDQNAELSLRYERESENRIRGDQLHSRSISEISYIREILDLYILPIGFLEQMSSAVNSIDPDVDLDFHGNIVVYSIKELSNRSNRPSEKNL